MQEQRIDWLDVLKGIGILLVVLGHRNMPYPLLAWIYSFHMPLFFFASGFLFKLRESDNFKKFVLRKVKALFIPYFFFVILSLLVLVLKNVFGNHELINIKELIFGVFYLNGKVIWNTPLWFLVCLFATEIIFYIIKKIEKQKLLFLITLAGSSIIGYLFSLFPAFRLPWGIDISFTALVFFGIGNILSRERNGFEKIFSIKWLLLTISVGTNILFAVYINERVDLYKLQYGNYFYFYIAAFSGILTVVLLAQIFSSVSLFKFYGTNSLLIMGTHYIFLWMLDIIKIKVLELGEISKISIFTGFIDILILMIVFVPVIWFTNRHIPFLGKYKKVNKDLNKLDSWLIHEK